MATLPTEAVGDHGVVRSLIAAGAGCVRINCAHDDALAWRRMASHVGPTVSGRPRCRVLMDLAGP